VKLVPKFSPQFSLAPSLCLYKAVERKALLPADCIRMIRLALIYLYFRRKYLVDLLGNVYIRFEVMIAVFVNNPVFQDIGLQQT
jgi:hypothetical protein